MTSNIGSPLLIEGLNSKGEITEKARQAVMAELRKHFRPEFLNRVDEIVLFKPLTLAEIKKIVDLLLDLLRLRLTEKRITLTLTDAAREHIGREGYDPVYGARPLKRYLQREVETRLSRKLLVGEILDGSALTLDAKNGSLEIRIGK
jgi:ATP-dependent Clp protease ATP-binding subunit ClpB